MNTETDNRLEVMLGNSGWGARVKATGEWVADGYDTGPAALRAGLAELERRAIGASRSEPAIIELAGELGIDIETGDTTPGGFVELLLDEVLAVPAGLERVAAVVAANDGSAVEDRHAYLDRVIGARVQLKHDVDRYPHFVAPRLALGTIVDVGDPTVFAVRLDEPLEGAEEWSNEVQWSNDDDPLTDIAIVELNTDTPAAIDEPADEGDAHLEYRRNVRRTFRAMTDYALEYQDRVIAGGIDREELEVEMLRRAYLDEARTLGDSVVLTDDDARFVAENLDYLAGVDEGENTDRDRLFEIARKIEAQLGTDVEPRSYIYKGGVE